MVNIFMMLLLSQGLLAQVPQHLGANTLPKSKTSKSWSQLCLDQSASQKDKTQVYDEALSKCAILQMKKQKSGNGFSDCQKVAKAISDISTKRILQDNCQSYFGVEKCLQGQSDQKSCKICLEKNIDFLPEKKCHEKLKKFQFSKNRELENLCRESAPKSQDPDLEGVK